MYVHEQIFVINELGLISTVSYLQGGALLSSISSPGYHFMVPAITSFRSIQVNSDKVLINSPLLTQHLVFLTHCLNNLDNF